MIDPDKVSTQEKPLIGYLSNSMVNEIEEQDIEISHIEVICSRKGRDLRNSMWTKLLVLFFSCNLLVGLYYCYDIPGTLNTQIMKDYDVDQPTEMLLYSVYNIPNFVMPLFGGLILDKIGIRIGMLIFIFVLVAGQAIFTFGAYQNSFAWLLVGRVIFGLGGESLCVA